MTHRCVLYGIAGLGGAGIIVAALLAYTFFADADTSSGTHASSAKGIVTACADEHRSNVSKETCYSKAFENLAKQAGPQAAFDTLFTVQSLDDTARSCHFIGHGIGYGTYARSPDTWRDNFRNINQACTYGAMHGILEMAVADLPNGLTRENLPSICGNNPRGNCNHIVGHLTLLETKGNIDQALDLCKALTAERERRNCYTGVFMENITADNLVEHGYADASYWDHADRADDIVEMCQSYHGLAHRACWREAAHTLNAKFGKDIDAIVSTCKQAQTTTASRMCQLHAISSMLGAEYYGDVSAAREICHASGTDAAFRRGCYLQLAASAIHAAPRKGETVLQFCAKAPASVAQTCAGYVGNFLRGVSAPDITVPRTCNSLASSTLAKSCRSTSPVVFDPLNVHSDE